MPIKGGRRCKLNAYVHIQDGRGGGGRSLKLQDLSVRILWMTHLQCNKHLFKQLISYSTEIPDTYFSRIQLSSELL